ncbi:hypothetical protein HBB16_05155 [Pseudonocardia sp. MCCB 268]|nr:hypothetical protein [Pseudonocardia cytotoxica]
MCFLTSCTGRRACRGPGSPRRARRAPAARREVDGARSRLLQFTPATARVSALATPPAPSPAARAGLATAPGSAFHPGAAGGPGDGADQPTGAVVAESGRRARPRGPARAELVELDGPAGRSDEATLTAGPGWRRCPQPVPPCTAGRWRPGASSSTRCSPSCRRRRRRTGTEPSRQHRLRRRAICGRARRLGGLTWDDVLTIVGDLRRRERLPAATPAGRARRELRRLPGAARVWQVAGAVLGPVAWPCSCPPCGGRRRSGRPRPGGGAGRALPGLASGELPRDAPRCVDRDAAAVAGARHRRPHDSSRAAVADALARRFGIGPRGRRARPPERSMATTGT